MALQFQDWEVRSPIDGVFGALDEHATAVTKAERRREEKERHAANIASNELQRKRILQAMGLAETAEGRAAAGEERTAWEFGEKQAEAARTEAERQQEAAFDEEIARMFRGEGVASMEAMRANPTDAATAARHLLPGMLNFADNNRAGVEFLENQPPRMREAMSATAAMNPGTAGGSPDMVPAAFLPPRQQTPEEIIAAQFAAQPNPFSSPEEHARAALMARMFAPPPGKPLVVAPNSSIYSEDGQNLLGTAPPAPKERKLHNVADGAHVLDPDGNLIYENPKDASSKDGKGGEKADWEGKEFGFAHPQLISEAHNAVRSGDYDRIRAGGLKIMPYKTVNEFGKEIQAQAGAALEKAKLADLAASNILAADTDTELRQVIGFNLSNLKSIGSGQGLSRNIDPRLYEALQNQFGHLGEKIWDSVYSFLLGANTEKQKEFLSAVLRNEAKNQRSLAADKRKSFVERISSVMIRRGAHVNHARTLADAVVNGYAPPDKKDDNPLGFMPGNAASQPAELSVPTTGAQAFDLSRGWPQENGGGNNAPNNAANLIAAYAQHGGDGAPTDAAAAFGDTKQAASGKVGDLQAWNASIAHIGGDEGKQNDVAEEISVVNNGEDVMLLVKDGKTGKMERLFAPVVAQGWTEKQWERALQSGLAYAELVE